MFHPEQVPIFNLRVGVIRKARRNWVMTGFVLDMPEPSLDPERFRIGHLDHLGLSCTISRLNGTASETTEIV